MWAGRIAALPHLKKHETEGLAHISRRAGHEALSGLCFFWSNRVADFAIAAIVYEGWIGVVVRDHRGSNADPKSQKGKVSAKFYEDFAGYFFQYPSTPLLQREK